MNTRLLSLSLCMLTLALLAGSAIAQASDTLPHQRAYFAPLDLPAATRYRTASGAPGDAYWQQRADYCIAVRLDLATHRLTGTETITYTNNAPTPCAISGCNSTRIFLPPTAEARCSNPATRAGAVPLTTVATLSPAWT